MWHFGLLNITCYLFCCHLWFCIVKSINFVDFFTHPAGNGIRHIGQHSSLDPDAAPDPSAPGFVPKFSPDPSDPDFVPCPNPDPLALECVPSPDFNSSSPDFVPCPNPDPLALECVPSPVSNSSSPDFVPCPNPDPLALECVPSPVSNSSSPDFVLCPDPDLPAPCFVPMLETASDIVLRRDQVPYPPAPVFTPFPDPDSASSPTPDFAPSTNPDPLTPDFALWPAPYFAFCPDPDPPAPCFVSKPDIDPSDIVLNHDPDRPAPCFVPMPDTLPSDIALNHDPDPPAPVFAPFSTADSTSNPTPDPLVTSCVSEAFPTWSNLSLCSSDNLRSSTQLALSSRWRCGVVCTSHTDTLSWSGEDAWFSWSAMAGGRHSPMFSATGGCEGFLTSFTGGGFLKKDGTGKSGGELTSSSALHHLQSVTFCTGVVWRNREITQIITLVN